MSGTHLKWIAAAVVALLVLWGAARFFPSGGGGAAAHGFRLAPVPADSADTITITAPPHTIVVRRAAAGGWTVNDFPAAGDAVGELFAAWPTARRPSSWRRARPRSSASAWTAWRRGACA
jgi:hypothetical protein